jgi:COP9 signalosome complex subunit 2
VAVDRPRKVWKFSYALQIQLYSRQKDNKKLREVFNKAMGWRGVAVRGGIPHPRTLALIQEVGGKMHMAAQLANTKLQARPFSSL